MYCESKGCHTIEHWMVLFNTTSNRAHNNKIRKRKIIFFHIHTAIVLWHEHLDKYKNIQHSKRFNTWNGFERIKHKTIVIIITICYTKLCIQTYLFRQNSLTASKLENQIEFYMFWCKRNHPKRHQPILMLYNFLAVSST